MKFINEFTGSHVGEMYQKSLLAMYEKSLPAMIGRNENL